jgi:hypothetical protein
MAIGGSSSATGGTKPTTGGTEAATGGNSAQACPDSSDYVGNSAWPHQLVVTSNAQYCGMFDEARTLEQEYPIKAKLRIAAGTYRLSNTAGTYDFALPVCFERLPGLPVPTFAGAGSASFTVGGGDVIGYGPVFNQPLGCSDGGTWRFYGSIYYANTAAQPPVLDGGRLKSAVGPSPYPYYYVEFRLCAGAVCLGSDDEVFESCNPPYALNRHTITFDGGQVVFDLRLDGVFGQSMPAMLVSASGTLDGTAFTQTDYWKLVYSATHHHQIRRFAVLFDTPIGAACGLKVLGFDPYGQDMPEVSTVQCDLSNIAQRSVTGAVLDLP